MFVSSALSGAHSIYHTTVQEALNRFMSSSAIIRDYTAKGVYRKLGLAIENIE